MRYSMIFGLLVLITGCAGRPDASVLNSIDTDNVGGKSVRTLVVSTRVEDRKTQTFSTLRSRQANYQRFDISIPPDHVSGAIEWSNDKPDPQKHFVVTSRSELTRQAFINEAKRSTAAGKPLSIFVHGFNYNYPEAVLRAAQMAADANIGSDPIVFSWPSQASIAGYVADKDSAAYSRDALAQLLTDLAEIKTTEKTTLFGHSMGAWLVMEALRQLKLEGKDSVLAKYHVVLAAPDIDTDVFRKQLEVIGPLNPPLTVLVSTDDRALQVSALIGADVQRVGALDVTDPSVREVALKQQIQFVDISTLNASSPMNHDRYASLAAIIPALNENRRNGSTPIGQAGAFVFDAIGQTVSSPFRLASQVVNPR